MWRRERRARRIRRREGINATDRARRRQRNSGTGGEVETKITNEE
jgi:hypothetical protein